MSGNTNDEGNPQGIPLVNANTHSQLGEICAEREVGAERRETWPSNEHRGERRDAPRGGNKRACNCVAGRAGGGHS